MTAITTLLALVLSSAPVPACAVEALSEVPPGQAEKNAAFRPDTSGHLVVTVEGVEGICDGDALADAVMQMNGVRAVHNDLDHHRYEIWFDVEVVRAPTLLDTIEGAGEWTVLMAIEPLSEPEGGGRS